MHKGELHNNQSKKQMNPIDLKSTCRVIKTHASRTICRRLGAIRSALGGSPRLRYCCFRDTNYDTGSPTGLCCSVTWPCIAEPIGA
jgi:hypothetical protein